MSLDDHSRRRWRPWPRRWVRMVIALWLSLALNGFPTYQGAGEPWSGFIDPSRALDWSHAGIPGGIPARTTVCATVDASVYGDGSADATAAIQSAIDGCPPGQVVSLPAGTYKTTSTVELRKGIVLRGNGVSSKVLVYGANVGVYMGQGSGGPPVSLSGSYPKGATQITMTQSAAISVGQYVVVDELSPSFVDNPRTYLCEDRSNNGYAAGARCITQINRVAAVGGNTLTLERPLYFDYDSALSPRLYAWNMVEGAGLESLRVERAENVGTGVSHIVQIFGCAHCWVRGVETYRGRGDHIQLWYSYANEIRDNFSQLGWSDYATPPYGYDGGRNYGIHIAWGPNSDHLIENNIVDSTRHALILEGPGSGNVIAYNYALNGLVYNDPVYNTGTASNHGAHPYMNLWEGNYVHGRLSFDHTHGGGSHNTIFRNRITRGPASMTGGAWAIDLQQSQWYDNIVGNVLGFSGMSGCAYELGDSNSCAIYRFGHPNDGGAMITDANASATALRWGNFDYVTGTSKWDVAERPDGADVTHVLPASLYRPSKPSWFGSVSWPPIGPDIPGYSDDIPAKRCYDRQNLGSGGAFDPNGCYGTSGPPPDARGWWPETIFGIKTLYVIVGAAIAVVLILFAVRARSRRPR